MKALIERLGSAPATLGSFNAWSSPVALFEADATESSDDSRHQDLIEARLGTLSSQVGFARGEIYEVRDAIATGRRARLVPAGGSALVLRGLLPSWGAPHPTQNKTSLAQGNKRAPFCISSPVGGSALVQ